MKTLKTIQTLSKIAKIFSKIIFICSIVGLCCCIAGTISAAIGMEAFKIGDVTFKSILQKEAGISEGDLYLSMIIGAIYCAGTIFLAKFAEVYFDRELKAGTPFTFDGSKELMRLGILSICIPVAEQIFSAIAYAVMLRAFSGTNEPELEAAGSVSIGIAFIILSLICKYGAEMIQSKADISDEINGG